MWNLFTSHTSPLGEVKKSFNCKHNKVKLKRKGGKSVLYMLYSKRKNWVAYRYKCLSKHTVKTVYDLRHLLHKLHRIPLTKPGKTFMIKLNIPEKSKLLLWKSTQVKLVICLPCNLNTPLLGLRTKGTSNAWGCKTFVTDSALTCMNSVIKSCFEY